MSAVAQYSNYTVRDALMASNNAALPNAANTVNTTAIDLGSTKPFPATGQFIATLSNTTATGANSKNINYAFQHTNANADGTADNGNWANIPELAIIVVAGNAANAAINSTNVFLPPSTKRYLRGTATGEANGGNSSDGTFSIQLGF